MEIIYKVIILKNNCTKIVQCGVLLWDLYVVFATIMSIMVFVYNHKFEICIRSNFVHITCVLILSCTFEVRYNTSSMNNCTNSV